MIIYIYLTTNTINQKEYVGQHRTLNENDNYQGSGKLLKRAIKKYGKENFVTSIIEYCDENLLNEREIFWIKEKNTLSPNGYNIRKGGNSYYERTEIHKEKISKKNTGRKFSNEVNKKKSLPGEKNGMYGNGYKISGNKNGRFGLKLSDEVRKTFGRNQKGENNVFFGKTHSIETIERLRNTMKEKTLTCPYCNRIFDYRNYKRWHGENCKKKETN